MKKVMLRATSVTPTVETLKDRLFVDFLACRMVDDLLSFFCYVRAQHYLCAASNNLEYRLIR